MKSKFITALHIFILVILFTYGAAVWADNNGVVYESQVSKLCDMTAYYSWADSELFVVISDSGYRHNVDYKLIFAVTNQESHGQNITGSLNRNGTRDHGYAQINDAHLGRRQLKTIEDFYIPEKNFDFAAYYLSLALEKSNGDVRQALRLYNQGLNGKEKNYNNWAYVDRIITDYLATGGVLYHGPTKIV